MFGVNIQEELQIVEDYTKNKICISKLAKKYHHNSRMITRILDSHGVNHQRGVLKTGQTNQAAKRIFTQEEKNLVYQIYSSGGSVADCEKAVRCGQDALRGLLQELGIYKTKAERIRELPQNQRKYIVNDDFFSIESSNLAYLLGFLASDGTVSKERNEIALGLSSIDREILEKFHDVIGGRPIDDYITSDGFQVSKWSFTSQEAKQRLEKYSIVPNKTKILKPPYQLDKKYWIDYIRGYFDGDGSVNYLASNKALRWQICSATKEVLEWIVDFLYNEYHIPKVNIYSQPRKNISLYYFQYSTNATRMIYNILYTPNTWYLKRKKDKFEEILEKI